MNFGLFEQIVGLYLITCLIAFALIVIFSERPFEKITQIRKLIFILHAESIPGISNDVLKHIE